MSYLAICIEEGIKKGWDVSYLIREDWDEDQILQILGGLEDGLDVSIYAKKEFNWKEMLKVRFELLKEKRV